VKTLAEKCLCGRQSFSTLNCETPYRLSFIENHTFSGFFTSINLPPVTRQASLRKLLIWMSIPLESHIQTAFSALFY
jgi:hypothetical protein